MSLLFLCSLAGSEFFFYEIGFKKFHGLQKTCRAESFSWHNFCNGITSSNLAKLKNPQVCLKKNDVISDVFLLFLSKNLKTHFFPPFFRGIFAFPQIYLLNYYSAHFLGKNFPTNQTTVASQLKIPYITCSLHWGWHFHSSLTWSFIDISMDFFNQDLFLTLQIL